MSTKNIELRGPKDIQARSVGNTYDGKEIYKVSASLHETYTTKFFTPNTGAPSSYHSLALDWGSSDEFNLNGVLLEFTHTNKNATSANSQIIQNPYLLFSELKILVNGQELVYYDNQESIFLAVAQFFRAMNDQQRTAYLSTIFPTQSASPLSGETVLGNTSVYWSLPLEPLTKCINNISRSDGVARLTIEFRFVPDYAVNSLNGRFIKAGTDTNVYSASNIGFSNIALRLHTTKHSDPVLRNVPNPVIVIPKYDVKTYQVNFSTSSALQRVQLSTEFSTRPLVHGIWVYMFNTAAITAYNDADCCKVDSSVSQIGFELKFKSKTIMKYETTAMANMRRRFLFESYQRKHAKVCPPALTQESDDTTKVWIPPMFIDLSNTELHREDADVLAGLPSNSDIELIVYNVTSGGNYSSNANLNVALCYYERAVINPANGQLVYYQ